MKSTCVLGITLIATCVLAGGCSSQHSTRISDASLWSSHDVSLALLGGPENSSTIPVAPGASRTAGTFRLGAGDALGERVFVQYVAYVKANGAPQYASGESRTD